ncbi:restriction endonuclease subunit S [Aridibaculum aurantiacum]|uniref:restriction endonuclease subunit S n=1 Tax=Aridibaculum aurantiacum TaxID=2810307 RepID=UPI001A97C87F|nr:restriction endonuclease subunit S [Aridibaculum aurantiacum]
MSWKIEKLGNVITQRKEFITIDNSVEYKRCRVQVNRKGVVLRDIVKGIAINTKKQQVCREGDFLVAEIDAKVGGYGFVPSELEGAIVSSHYFLFELDETKLLKDYLAWLIKTDIIQDQITSKGSTNYAAIRPHHVLNFEIPLPSLGEQAVIVHRLNIINEEYSLLDKELDQQQTYLQLLRQTILQEAVQGKLTKQDPTEEPATELLKRIKAEKEKLIKAGKLKKEKELPPITEDEIPFELSEGWAWVRGDDVASFIDPQPSHRTPPVVLNGVPYIGMTEVRDDGTIDFDSARKVSVEVLKEHNKRYTLEDGDFIIGKIGTIGEPTFLPKPFNYTLSANIILVQPFRNSIDAHFITYYLQSPIAIDLLKSQSTNSTHLVFGIKKSRMLLFPLPPMKVQKVIVAKVQQLQQQLSQLEAQVQQSRQYAQQLLQSVLREAFEQRGKVYEMEEEQVLNMVAEGEV